MTPPGAEQGSRRARAVDFPVPRRHKPPLTRDPYPTKPQP